MKTKMKTKNSTRKTTSREATSIYRSELAKIKRNKKKVDAFKKVCSDCDSTGYLTFTKDGVEKFDPSGKPSEMLVVIERGVRYAMNNGGDSIGMDNRGRMYVGVSPVGYDLVRNGKGKVVQKRLVELPARVRRVYVKKDGVVSDGSVALLMTQVGRFLQSKDGAQ